MYLAPLDALVAVYGLALRRFEERIAVGTAAVQKTRRDSIFMPIESVCLGFREKHRCADALEERRTIRTLVETPTGRHIWRRLLANCRPASGGALSRERRPKEICRRLHRWRILPQGGRHDRAAASPGTSGRSSITRGARKARVRLHDPLAGTLRLVDRRHALDSRRRTRTRGSAPSLSPAWAVGLATANRPTRFSAPGPPTAPSPRSGACSGCRPSNPAESASSSWTGEGAP